MSEMWIMGCLGLHDQTAILRLQKMRAQLR